ncbi:MAG TPA: hypothetical protein P5155_01565 [Candidatus Absconditabacterales bacterium]|nr:hypothetical protein [Candidatus Absconditabacterales bacterium]
MDTSRKTEIKKTIDNPITKSMKPGQKALESTISKSGKQKLASNQISIGMDKREKKLGDSRKPN